MPQICFFAHSDEGRSNGLFRDTPDAGGMADFRTAMLEADYRCDTDDLCDTASADVFAFHRLDLVAWRVARALRRNPHARLALFAWEEPLVCGLHEEDILTRLDLDRIFTWRDDLAGRGKLAKANIPQANRPLQPMASAFAGSKFIVAVDGYKVSSHPRELYSLRRSTLRDLACAGAAIDLFGRGWDYCPDSELRGLWRGVVDDKLAIQAQYRFSLCIQNSADYPGDICEKIFDIMQAGSIPIYRGASNIEAHVPRDCFIDMRQFEGPEKLLAYLRHFSESDFLRMRQAALNFLRGDYRSTFTGAALAGRVAPLLSLDLANPPTPRSGPSWLAGLFTTVLGATVRPPRVSKQQSLRNLLASPLRG